MKRKRADGICVICGTAMHRWKVAGVICGFCIHCDRVHCPRCKLPDISGKAITCLRCQTSLWEVA